MSVHVVCYTKFLSFEGSQDHFQIKRNVRNLLLIYVIMTSTRKINKILDRKSNDLVFMNPPVWKYAQSKKASPNGTI